MKYQLTRCFYVSLALLVFTSVVSLSVPTVYAAGEKITMGMPFDGKWAYNIPTTAECGTAAGQTAHPSCHATSGTDLLGYHWAVDYYSGDGTDVKVNGSSVQGTVTFSSATATGSCGSSLTVTATVNSVNVGQMYVTHLDNALVSGSIANGTSIGDVRDSCFGVDHVHFSYKNLVSNYSCYVNHSNPSYTAGMDISNGVSIGVVGAGRASVQQACVSSDFDNGHPNPGVVAWDTGRIDLFGQGTGGSIFQKYFSSSWSGSWVIPVDGTLSSGPAVASWEPGRLDVFARDANGNLVHAYFGEYGWGGWYNLYAPNGLTLKQGVNPAAISWDSGRIDVFVQTSNDQLYQKYYTTGGGWSSWVQPNEFGGVSVTSGPAVASWEAGRLDVFARGSNGDMVHNYYGTNGWGNFESLSNPSGQTLMSGTNPASVSWGSGRIDTFVQATNGQVYQKYYDGGSGWSTWTQPLSTTAVGSGPAVSTWGTNRLDVFVRGTSGDMNQAYFDGSWHYLYALGGGFK